jgi:hypothetical protein
MRKSGSGLSKHIKSRYSRKTAKRLEVKRLMLAAKKKKRK